MNTEHGTFVSVAINGAQSVARFMRLICGMNPHGIRSVNTVTNDLEYALPEGDVCKFCGAESRKDYSAGIEYTCGTTWWDANASHNDWPNIESHMIWSKHCE